MSLSFSQSKGGKLVIITGPMFSGKTSTLISELTRYVDLDIPVAYINSSEDTRGETFSTHNSSFSQVSPKFNTIKSKKLSGIDVDLNQYDVLAIDESQFFDDLTSFVKKWLSNGKIIYVAGLDGDIEQNIFGDIVYLIPYATEVRKLNAVCEICRENKEIISAPFTIRKTEAKEKKLIGGKDVYLPVCTHHLFDLKAKEKAQEKAQEKVQNHPTEYLNYVI